MQLYRKSTYKIDQAGEDEAENEVGSQQRLSTATYKIGYQEIRKDRWVMSLAASDMLVRGERKESWGRRSIGGEINGGGKDLNVREAKT